MDKELVTHIVEHVKLANGNAGEFEIDSPAAMLRWELRVHEFLMQLGREVVWSLAAEMGTGYQGPRVKRGNAVLRFKGCKRPRSGRWECRDLVGGESCCPPAGGAKPRQVELPRGATVCCQGRARHRCHDGSADGGAEGQSKRSSVTMLEESMILMSLAAACRMER